jgi:hypothetical protein
MKLPILLSGPIIRRVDTSSVAIWIATSRRFQIGAELFKIDGSEHEYSYKLLSDIAETQTLRLGKRLYINMITIKPMNGLFPTNTLLGYNLLFSRHSNTVDLNSFGLLEHDHPHSIVYGSLKYPSFYIHSGENGSLLYGSCNKLHGKGNHSLASADLHLEEEFNNLKERPHSLFLLGDQIYADDVPDPVFPVITELHKKLVGNREDLTVIEDRLTEPHFKESINKINGRQYIMDYLCQFSSKDAYNHLMKFGEYATLYLLLWGPQLWDYAVDQGLISTFSDQLEKDQVHLVFPKEEQHLPQHQKEIEQLEERYNEQWWEVQENLHVLPKISRLLANTPTYMMLDDHDVTDDLYLTYNWKRNVWNSPLGRHVVANGLGAYWAFQGWGNCPDSYSPTFLRIMKRYCYTFSVGTIDYQNWIESLWNYDSWHFVAPTEPKAIFLDTRTMRSYQSPPRPVKFGEIIEETPRGPQLISKEGWEKLSDVLLKSGWRSGERLIINSPVPLYGVGLIESSLDSYVHPLRALGIPIHEMIDYEAWKYNGEGFTQFINKVVEWNPSHCFILSGDVHYASNVRSHIKTDQGEQATILQFTSSPIQNMSFSGIWGALVKGAIWLNTLKRKKKEINRYCDSSYQLVMDDHHDSTPVHWTESIRYLSTDKGHIIETNNNMGLIQYTSHSVQNKLLQYKNLEKQEIPFERINLSKYKGH